MNKENSAFFQFGLLPEICIHSLEEDQYSKSYVPRNICKCGASLWKESTMKIIEDSMGYEFPKKAVHRCIQCNEVRMADHIGIKDE